jgi:hypothetical protein
MEKFNQEVWRVVEGSNSCHCCFDWSIVDEFGNSVCEGWSEHANIIAVAPEMYDLLSTIENDSNQVPEWLREKIKTTLAKARG